MIQPVLKMKECVKGCGDLCGAKTVDAAFSNLLRSKFGEERWARMSPQSTQKINDEHWEHTTKAYFEGKQKSRDLLTPVPFECQTVVERAERGQEYIVITPVEIEQIFEPAFNKIFDMLDDQMACMSEAPKVPDYFFSCISPWNCSVHPLHVFFFPPASLTIQKYKLANTW